MKRTITTVFKKIKHFIDCSKKRTITIPYNTLILILLGLTLISSVFSYAFYYNYNYKTGDDVLDYIEFRISEFPNPTLNYLESHFNHETKVEDVLQLYWNYNYISRMMLRNEIDKLCGTKEWSFQHPNIQETLKQENLSLPTQYFDTYTYLIPEKVK